MWWGRSGQCPRLNPRMDRDVSRISPFFFSSRKNQHSTRAAVALDNKIFMLLCQVQEERHTEIMTDSLSDFLETVSDFAKEILAIVSNIAAVLSTIWAIIGLLEFISQQGVVQGYFSWLAIGLVSSFISGLFAEILHSSIPTPLKWMLEMAERLLEILGQI